MSNKSQLKRVVTQSPEFAYLKITELETQLAERDAKIAALKAQLVGYTELAKDTIAALEVADAKIADLDSAAESLWKK